MLILLFFFLLIHIQAPIFVFVVDFTKKSISDGTAAASLHAIKNLIISRQFRGDGVRVGVITFNTRINFYDVRPSAREPIQIITQHPEDCFAPLPLSHWLHSPYSPDNNTDNYHTPQHTSTTQGSNPGQSNTPGSGGKINALLLLLDKLLHYCESENNSVPNMFPDANCQESCPMEALKAAQACLADTGGRVFLFTSSALGCGMERGAEGIKRGVQGQVV